MDTSKPITHTDVRAVTEHGRTLFYSETASPVFSPAAMRRVAVLFGPALFLVTFLRLLQLSLIGTAGRMPLDTLLLGLAPPPFFISVLALLLGALARKTWPRIRLVWIVSGTILLGGVLFTIAAHTIPPWLSDWLSARAFEVVRWDALALLLFGFISLVALAHLRGWLRGLYLAVMHGLVGLLLILPIVEVGCIWALGAAPDWSMLAYSMQHLSELAPVLGSEATPGLVVLLLLPLLITLLPFLLERALWQRRGTLPRKSGRPVWYQALTVAPLLLAVALPSSTTLPPTTRTISYAGMAHSMMESLATDEGLDNLADTDLPFDAAHSYLAETDSTRRMNVVVILLESFRSRSVTPYTPSLATTPFLDALARQSLLVEQMYAVVSYTNKSLAPILAGIYPEPTTYVVEARPEGIPAQGLPTLLKPFGYRSAFFTPAMLAFERKDKILDHLGFDEMYGDGAYPTDGFHNSNYFGYEDRIVLEPSMNWVDKVTSTGQPFFLTYLTLSSHHDYQTPPDFPHQTFDAHDEELNDYLNALHYTDAFLRDLFHAFDQRDLLDSTLFILLGDHGEAFGEHGLRTHGDIIWDEALHIPALVYNPVLFPKGGRVQGLRQYIDIVPTVVDALNLGMSGGRYPGRSLLHPVPEDRILYHHAKNGRSAMALRQDSLKFFYYRDHQPMEVYNLSRDPYERHNIVDEIAPQRLKTVEMQLLLWQRGTQKVYDDYLERASALATHERRY